MSEDQFSWRALLSKDTLRERVRYAKEKTFDAKKPDELEDLPAVLRKERGQIHRRRWRLSNINLPADHADAEQEAKRTDVPPIVHGLALSGGGIRSATFSLGLLQSLNELGILPRFDYLSTVSGGGFAGGWWSAWLSRTSRNGKIFPPPEKIEPEREPIYRVKDVAEGSRSAKEHDPVHHVRLFANYLTPRKGVLSADTWFAATVVGRNLLLTWLVMLPVLLAAILLAQLWFAGMLGPDFYGKGVHTAEAVLRAKLVVALAPVAVIAALIGVLTLAWLLNSGGYWVPALLGMIAVAFIGVTTRSALMSGTDVAAPWSPWGWVLLGVAAPLFLWYVAPLISDLFIAKQGSRTARRNWIARLQARLVMVAVLLAVTFLIAGFGNDIADYLLSSARTAWYDYVAKTGGWLAAATAIASSIYTAISASPSAGGDASKTAGPGKLGVLAMQMAPALMLLLLGVAGAKLMHVWVAPATPDTLPALTTPTWVAVALLVLFAAHETVRDETEMPPLRRAAIVGVPALVALVAYTLPADSAVSRAFTIAAIAAGAVAITGRLAGLRIMQWVVQKFPSLRNTDKRTWFLAGAAAILAGTAAWTLASRFLGGIDAIDFWRTIIAILLFCGAFSIAEMRWGVNQRRRAAVLVAIAFACTLSLSLPGVVQAGQAVVNSGGTRYGLIVFALVVITLSAVVGFGWLADPNQLSLHTFYRARIERAYLGASNDARRNQQISESHAEDGVSLTRVVNCREGGPYHLINTTLNLVGGRDLATAQRFADNFVLAPLHCGSSRTGYRDTNQYMKGALGLGTAVAISGAAVSSTMGAKTGSAALSMLLTLFNARLGYWAPNPGGGRYRSSQARLWPFYTLRESLSQTNALGTYCYLTDGGHFDNSGVYALVQRGCRVIVVADCGADPKPAFEDIGTAIRRCRIDFGADIRLGEFTTFQKGTKAPGHVAFGEIIYSQAHAEKLGWGAGLHEQRRTGLIVWIKPASTGDESLDVIQYGLANDDFPQQPTVDQWYDEAQFESYRRLGFHSGQEAFGMAQGQAGQRFAAAVQQIVP